MSAIARVVLALLFLSFTLDAQNIPETPVSDVTYFHNQEDVRAAGSDGENFLIAGLRPFDPAVYAHRVTAGGALLDNIRIGLPQGSFSPAVLGVFWNGDAYTIVITTSLSVGVQGLATFVARIDADGHLVVPARQVASGWSFFDAASNGRRIVLAGPKLAVLDTEGNLIELNVYLPPPPAATNNWNHHIASNGDGFMVSWLSPTPGQNNVAIAPLDGNGHPTGAPVTVPAFAQVVASDGNDYVVVYQRSSGDQFAQHVSASGQLLDNPQILPRWSFPKSNDMFVRLLWNGTSYVAALNTIGGGATVSTPSAIRLDRTGAPLGMTSMATGSTGPAGGAVALATNGRQVLMSWSEGTETAPRWFGGLLGSDFKVASKFPVGVTATLQLTPSVASDKKSLFTVWEESDTIYGSFLSLLNGQRGAGLKLSSTPAHGPRVVWDGQAYVVAWRAGNPSLMTTARVSSDGAIVQAGTPVFPYCVNDFDITSGGDSMLAVAVECSARRLVAARVHRDGTAGQAVDISYFYNGSPRVAWSGAQFLIVWRQLAANILPYGPEPGNVWAARLSPSMTVLDPAPLPIAVGDNEYNSLPLVASDGRDFIVAWTSTGPYPTEPEPRVRTVSAGAALGDVSRDFGLGSATSLIWDGQRFALALTTKSSDILLRRIGTDSFTTISATADPESSAAITAAGNGAIVAAYVRTASEAVYGSVPRVFLKTFVAPRSRAVR